jgi:hypothetical protein
MSDVIHLESGELLELAKYPLPAGIADETFNFHRMAKAMNTSTVTINKWIDAGMESSPSSGKTSPASCPTKTTPLGASWADLSAQWMPCSHQQTEAGQVRVWCRGQGHGSLGPFSTPNGSEWRSGAVACSLSSILENASIPQRYYLSQTACAGILRRAERRGKTLPDVLHQALRAVVEHTPGT